MNLRGRSRQLAHGFSALMLLSSFGCEIACCQTSGDTGFSGPAAILPEYQARAPRKCASVTKPPSVAQAAIMVQCSMDGLGSTGLSLIQDVKIEMGKPRPFVYQTDAGLAGIDLSEQVYPLRGSYTGYFCTKIGGTLVPAGHSCIRSAVPESQGWCWKTSFGDYTCKMHGGATPKMEPGMPAPTAY